jgi:trehalose synthase
MLNTIEPNTHLTLDDYASHAHLAAAVAELHGQARAVAQRMRGRTIWMVNSTAEGGGVAELLHTHVSLLHQLGFDVRWIVLQSSDAAFFPFTKRLHNLIHADPQAAPTDAERVMFERVNSNLAMELTRELKAGDVLIVHDPQPAPLGLLLKQHHDVHMVWRCHIGVDVESVGTRAAWEFLRPYAEAYDDVVFSLAEYVPAYLREHAHIIHPSIDPLSHKNRELSLHKLVGVLADADLAQLVSPLTEPPFAHRARRLQADGSLVPANGPQDIGLLTRPIITQVSRWDRLKGFPPLMEAFALLKTNANLQQDEQHARLLSAARLVLAGPDPTGVHDDPEGQSVFAELAARYAELPANVQNDVAVLTLPMHSPNENALIVNALQRAADIVVQNSVREGFGLTVAEAMWKRIPILGSATACGVRLQVRDHIDGRLVPDPQDPAILSQVLAEMLMDRTRMEQWGRSGQRRVYDHFLVFSELQHWVSLFNR